MAPSPDRPAEACGAFDCMGVMELYGVARGADGSVWVHQWYESPDPVRPIVALRSVDWELRPPDGARLSWPLAGRGILQLKVAWLTWSRPGERAAVSLFHEAPLAVAARDGERWIGPPVVAADGTLHWLVWRPEGDGFRLVRHRFTGALERPPSVASEELPAVTSPPVASAALPLSDAMGTGAVIAWLTVEAGRAVVEAAWLEGEEVVRRRIATGMALPPATAQHPGLQLRADRTLAVAFVAIDGGAPALVEARLAFGRSDDAIAVVARPAPWTEPAHALSVYVRGTASRLARCFLRDAEGRLWGLGSSGMVLLDPARPADDELAIVAGSDNVYELRQAGDGSLRFQAFPALW